MSFRDNVHRSGIAAVSLVFVLGLSACSQADGGSPKPTTTGSSTPTSPSGDPAVQIENPKNLGAVTDACALLTSAQLKQLQAATTGEPGTTAYGGPECKWSNDKFATRIGVNTKTGTGPEELAQRGKASGSFVKIAGYPAAIVAEQSILCRIEVGVAKGQSFSISYAKYSGDTPAMQDPCGYAKKIATEVLTNIPNA